jgi:hypothetical protein
MKTISKLENTNKLRYIEELYEDLNKYGFLVFNGSGYYTHPNDLEEFSCLGGYLRFKGFNALGFLNSFQVFKEVLSHFFFERGLKYVCIVLNNENNTFQCIVRTKAPQDIRNYLEEYVHVDCSLDKEGRRQTKILVFEPTRIYDSNNLIDHGEIVDTGTPPTLTGKLNE